MGPEPQCDPRRIAEGAAAARSGRHGQGAGAPRPRHRARPQRGGSLSGRVAPMDRSKSPSPPFRGEREGPNRDSDWEGEVGRGERSGIPHLTPALSAPGGGGGGLFTIGYEKARLPDVIAALTQAGVATLIDVRDRPISRRPGFSKRQLTAAAEEAGMRYLHLQA